MRRASDFEYDLPPELIAQEPLADRAASRLLVLDRSSGDVRHARFPDLVDLVAPEDVLVLNVSRVIPARLHGMRDAGSGMRGSGGKAELLLVRELPDGTWLAMGHPGGKLKPGRTVRFGDDSAAALHRAWPNETSAFFKLTSKAWRCCPRAGLCIPAKCCPWARPAEKFAYLRRRPPRPRP